MAYATRYYGTLIDHFNRTVEVYIYQRDYTGLIVPVVLAGVNKTINGSDDKLFTEIIGSSVSVGFLSETNFAFIELYTADKRKYKLEVKIDGSSDWIGWIIPELFTEAYDAPPYITTVTARDGLGEFKTIPFDLTGLQTQVNVLEAALNHITGNITSTLYVGVNVFETRHVETESPLSQIYVDCERFEDMYYDEVIEDLCKLYGARLYQKDGAFWFVSVSAFFATEIQITKYTFYSAITQQTLDSSLIVKLANEDNFANTDHQLNILPAWKQKKVVKDLKLRESALENYSFSDWTQLGTVLTPDEWTQSETELVSKYVDNNIDGVYFNSQNSTPVKYIYQYIYNWKALSSQRSVFSITFKVVGTDDDSQFWFVIASHSEVGDVKYIQDNGAWTTTESYVNLQNIKGNGSFQTFELSIFDIPYDGTFRVLVYASDKGNLVVDKVEFTILQPPSLTSIEPVRYPKLLEKTHVIGNNAKEEEIKLITGDFPDIGRVVNPTEIANINEQHVYLGGLYMDSDKDEVSQSWHVAGGSTPEFSNHLSDIVLSSQRILVRTPQWSIKGSLMTKNIKSDSCIIDSTTNSNKYLLTNGTLDMENCIFNGTFIKVGNYADTGEWILTTGDWNDDNVWIDTELWID